MHKLLVDIAGRAGSSLGPGHSECIYQKAMSLLLQEAAVSHSCEYNVSVEVLGESGKAFHLGGERIDLYVYDTDGRPCVVELKAVTSSVLLKHAGKDLDSQNIPTAHMQLLKYIRMLPQSIAEGYVINFRQQSTFGNPSNLPVEVVRYSVETKTWENVASQ